MLRGAGAMLALPQLDIMANVAGVSPSTAPPKRFVSMFHPNGVYPKAWDIDKDGADYEISPILAPLEELRDEFTVISGLNNGIKGGHVSLTASFMTGGMVRKGKMNGSSLDQKIATHIGSDTAFKSLVLGTEPPRQGFAGSHPISIANTVSWSSESTRISPEINPAIAFDRLFRSRTGPEAIKEATKRKSVIDLVLDDAKRLRKKGSAADQQKLDEYIESVRAIERQLERTINPPKRSWDPPTQPSEADFARPEAGIPRERDKHLRMMMDLIVLGLWTDTTRVCTLMTAHGFSRQNFSFLDGVSGDHHSMSHHKGKTKSTASYTTVSRWYVEQFTYLLKRLKTIDEGGSTLLDNTVLLYGSGMKDGNGHTKENLPIVIAGGGKNTFNHGRHVSLKSQKLNNLHYTIAQKFGIVENDFNDTNSSTIQELG